MSKHKKKRNKVYAGADAAMTQPKVTKITAVSRTRTGQWWYEHEKKVKIAAKILGVIVFAIFIIFEIINILSGNPL